VDIKSITQVVGLTAFVAAVNRETKEVSVYPMIPNGLVLNSLVYNFFMANVHSDLYIH
jgi:hypothetical protein